MTEMNTSSWKEFRLDELFNIETTKGFDKNKIEFADDAPYDFIGRTSVNWGKQGSVNKLESTPNPKNTFSLVQIGETIALWRENEWYASQNIFLLCPKISRIKDVPLYFQTIINKEMSIFGKTYNSYPTLKSLHDTYLKLPVTSSGEIDWQYMQERIAELEQERIAELEHYLVASGLNDYELTEEDKFILMTKLSEGGVLQKSISGNGCWKEARKFRVGDLFESQTGDIDLQKRHINGNGCCVVTSGLENNGIVGKTDVSAKIFNANTITIDMFGNCFYRDEQYKMVTHARVFSLTPLFCGLNKHNGQYIVSQFKYLPSFYNYSNMCSWNKIKNDKLFLPIQTDTDHNPIIDPENTYHPEGYIPDWSFMEKYIRAVEKVVIKDVVDWKDEEIKKTIEIVS